MWNPFRRRSRADVHNLVVKNPETGLQEVHFIVTVDALAEAREAIVESFEAVVSGYRSNPDFGGQVVFVVRGPVPGSELPPELVEVRSELEAKVAEAGRQTTKGRMFQVRVEYKQSAW